MGKLKTYQVRARHPAAARHPSVYMGSRSVRALVAGQLLLVDGRPSYRELLPNAYSIEFGQTSFDNVGHSGGFRDHFRDAGFVWTVAFCQADSDGDGQSNGLELGDPCCTWTQDSVAQYLPA